MNLRRTFLALGAMILGVGFFGASPANAYVGTPHTQGTPGGSQVTCYMEVTTQYTINHWPGNHYWYCGTNEPSLGATAYGYLSTMNSQKTPASGISGRVVLFNNHVRFFVFQNAAAFQIFCQGSVISPVGAQRLIPQSQCLGTGQLTQFERGASLVGGTFPYSVVVESSVDGPSGQTVNEWSPYSYVKHNILHEAGHHEDKYLASLVTIPAGAPVWVNMSTQFATQLAKDWAAINAADAGNPVNTRNGCYNLSGSGMFIDDKDQNGNFICNNNGAGPLVNTSAGYTIGMNNKDVLQKAWPRIYKPRPGNALGDNAELAASMFAAYSGGNLMGPRLFGTTQDEGQYLGQFTCVQKLLGGLQLNGTVQQCP